MNRTVIVRPRTGDPLSADAARRFLRARRLL
jgi:hypothetical protein